MFSLMMGKTMMIALVNDERKRSLKAKKELWASCAA
jgi:hypothetical protein